MDYLRVCRQHSAQPTGTTLKEKTWIEEEIIIMKTSLVNTARNKTLGLPKTFIQHFCSKTTHINLNEEVHQLSVIPRDSKHKWLIFKFK